MTESKKGITLPYKVRPPKKIRVRLFFVLMLYIKFQVPSSSSSLVLQPTKGVTDKRMDGQMGRRTDGQAQTNTPLNFCEFGGITNIEKIELYETDLL